MKCPNCGAEMEEGSLYCVACGEDIHIVPDFEPRLDQDIQQTIKNITEDIWEKEDTAEADGNSTAPFAQKGREEQKKPDWKENGKRRKRILATAFLLTVVAAAGLGAALYHSPDYQAAKARKCTEKALYDKAVRYYERAIELDPDNVSLKVELADIYFLKNNKIEYEYLLRSIVYDENASGEQVESAYGKLIAIYRSREDYQEISDFLLDSDNEAIIMKYQNYVAKDPQFSVIEGYYTSIQPLKLSAFGTGRIYYTMDGSDPDENSDAYTAPILLESGDYVVKAIYISENGVRSNIVKKEYHIDIDELPPPEIGIASGDYRFPMNIEVADDNNEVYYTTDGTDPTKASTLYTGPIPMPLGESVFRFVRINNGMVSEVEERVYNLVLDTDITPDQAVDIVLKYCIAIDRIFDEAGYFDENGDRYLYEYQYVVNINGVDDFYVVMEILQDADKNLTGTGIYYAVNAYTGKIYRLQTDNGGYTLITLE